MDKTPFLSIVIPAYNEAVRLPLTLNHILSYLAQQSYTAELLVIDDGSVDNTVTVLEEMIHQHENIVVIKNQHRGKGYTVRTGMLAATGKFILFSDADLAVPIEELEKLLPYLASGYDIVIASREGQGACRIGEPYYRHIMGRVFNLIVRMFALGAFQDTQCGFKFFKRDAAQHIFSQVLLYGANMKQVKGPAVTGFDVELLFLAMKQGYKVKEVPIKWIYKAETKVNPIKDTWRNLMDIVRIRWYDLTGQYSVRNHVVTSVIPNSDEQVNPYRSGS